MRINILGDVSSAFIKNFMYLVFNKFSNNSVNSMHRRIDEERTQAVHRYVFVACDAAIKGANTKNR
jgi:hypothetical protein